MNVKFLLRMQHSLCCRTLKEDFCFLLLVFIIVYFIVHTLCKGMEILWYYVRYLPPS